jgi:hypothetical protein
MVPPVKVTDPLVVAGVPLQVFVSGGVAATVNPAGKVSVNATPVSPNVLAVGFVTVRVSEVAPFSGTLVPPNALVIAGGAATLMLAEAVLPVPPFVELTAPEVLVIVMPTAVPVTFTVSVQFVFTPTVPPAREMLPEPAVAVTVELVPQVFATPGVEATTRPAGSVSVKATPVWATVLAAGLVMVNVNALLALRLIAVGLNALLIVSGVTIGMVPGAFTVDVSPPPDMVIPMLTDWPAPAVTFPVTKMGS